MKKAAIILAVGQGTRMRSKVAKVLHPLMGKPMVMYSVETVTSAIGIKPVVVVGYEAEVVKQVVGEQAHCVYQEPQLGTGHAVRQAESILTGEAELILVVTADMPLLRVETLQNLLQIQQQNSGPITLLTVINTKARGFGRVIRDKQGKIQAIIEEAQASPEQLAINELNASVYCFSADWLWQALTRIPISPKGEYYLTDLVGMAAKDGLSIQSYTVEDNTETIGINTRAHLAEAIEVLRQRINNDWMLSGVTIIDPSATYIEPGVKIGRDTTIWPNSFLQGDTLIGENCVIGPNTIVRSTRIGNGCQIFASVLNGAIIEDNVDIGPFSHLRRDAHLAAGVHMGNFGEVKSSYLGAGTKMGHFSYIGDATIGPNVNIGAGTITCNYDGKKKYLTEIGADVFIGSDTMLVAPLKVGEGARTGAGSVVTKDVPPNSLAVGVPARIIRKLGKNE